MKRGGGWAFPRVPAQWASGDTVWGEPGMTLRDYFAAKAMAALVASNDEGAGDRITDIPGYAYEIADAMLAARAETQP